jgi:hypothetical protein
VLILLALKNRPGGAEGRGPMNMLAQEMLAPCVALWSLGIAAALVGLEWLLGQHGGPH